MWFAIGGGIVLAVAAFLIIRRSTGKSFPWIQFYTKGKESGFSLKEIGLLRRVAVDNKLENPTALFWSIKQLDRSIKATILRFRSEGREQEPGPVAFVSKLYEFRKRVEFSLPKWKTGLKSTRNIAPNTRLTISLPGAGTYYSTVVENLRRYLAISYPHGPKLPPGFSWRGEKINVYFWRVDDAGYFFQAKVLEDYIDKNYPILHIGHSDGLIRSQKRRSVRADVNKQARLYPLRNVNQVDETFEQNPGLRCRIVNVSEDGAAILIGGRAKVGLSVKFQFQLGGEPIVMNGVVKGVNYDQKKNQSVLHIEAVAVSPFIRNNILAFVYNIFSERKDVYSTVLAGS
jgi:c-di-GMP-binding flagellar brake protein YcgR